MIKDDAKQLLTKARARLLQEDCPYWGTLCMGMDLVEDTNHSKTLGTMATDGKTIYWDRAYVEGLSVPELEFTLAHEAGIHKGLLHHIRLAIMKEHGVIDFAEFNRAADYVGNLILISANVGKPPKGILIDNRFRGMELEKVYNILMREKEQQEQQQGGSQDGQGGGGQEDQGSDDKEDQGSDGQEDQGGGKKGQGQPKEGDDPGRCGGVIPPPPDVDPKELEQEAKEEVRNALQASKKAGSMPGGLSRVIEELLEPTIDWKSWLWQFVQEYSYKDYSWNRPSKRYLPRGLYMPEIRGTELSPVVELIDASGSVTQEQLRELTTEGLGVVRSFPGAVLNVIFFDTVAKEPVEITDEEQIRTLDLSGLGGGTDYRPAFKKLEEAQLTPSCVIVLTDGECDYFPASCPYPVLWVINNKNPFKPPFGEVIQMQG